MQYELGVLAKVFSKVSIIFQKPTIVILRNMNNKIYKKETIKKNIFSLLLYSLVCPVNKIDNRNDLNK